MRRVITTGWQSLHLVFLAVPAAPSSALALFGRSFLTCRGGGGAKAGTGGGGGPASRTPCIYAAAWAMSWQALQGRATSAVSAHTSPKTAAGVVCSCYSCDIFRSLELWEVLVYEIVGTICDAGCAKQTSAVGKPA